jgi:hypothetical protein
VTETWPQPNEGITGTSRIGDDLLSLDDAAMPRRRMMIMMGLCLRNATRVGNPAPIVQRMDERMRNPQPGDLVYETSTARRPGSELYGLGILIAHRIEWWSSDEDWARAMADEPESLRSDDNRPTDHAWYIQFGPGEQNVYRWVNCEFMMLPTDPGVFDVPIGTRDGNSVTYTRSDLLGGLADSGFTLQSGR